MSMPQTHYTIPVVLVELATQHCKAKSVKRCKSGNLQSLVVTYHYQATQECCVWLIFQACVVRYFAIINMQVLLNELYTANVQSAFKT